MTDKDYSKAAKEYFSKIRKTDRLIQRLTNTVATLRSSLTSQNYELNPDKVQTSGPKDKLADTIAKIVDFEADINRHIDELIDQKAEFMRRIYAVQDRDQQNVLIARYVDGVKWEKIAVDLNFSIAQIYRIHGAALLSFAEKNPDIIQYDSKRE